MRSFFFAAAMRLFSLGLLFVTMAHGEERSFLLMAAGPDRQEAVAWGRDVLDAHGLAWTDSEDWIPPSDWKNHAGVIIAGKSPQLLDDATAAEVKSYLQKGGMLIAVGAALPSLAHPPNVKSSSVLPEAIKNWVGASRWVFPPFVEDYQPQTQIWPWEQSVPFQPEMYGTQPYCLMEILSAETVLGTDKLAIIAVNRVGTGAFIFMGPQLHRLQSHERVERLAPEEGPVRLYVEMIATALKTIQERPEEP